MFGLWNSETVVFKTPIQKYFDNLGYFDHRELVYEARKGNLASIYPAPPYTQKEILTFAFKDKEENWGGASYNALDGAGSYTYLMGEPEINPITELPTTKDQQTGIFASAYNSTTKTITDLAIKAFVGISVLGAGYLFLKPYFENMSKHKK